MAIQLEAAEQQVRAQLSAIYDTICARTGSLATGASVTQAQNDADHAQMETLGRSLHISLVQRGIVPVHSPILVKNRGMQPHEKGFYEHLHAVESLLKQT